jgi:hypothetical protein
MRFYFVTTLFNINYEIIIISQIALIIADNKFWKNISSICKCFFQIKCFTIY